MEPFIALVTLTAMEIVLGIDNIVFIAIVTSRLPVEKQAKARRIGLLLALGMRIALLFTATWVMRMTDPFFELSSLGIFTEWFESHEEINGVSGKDMIVLGGGLFLLWKSVTEIHRKLDGQEESHDVKGKATMGSVLAQICMLDIVFSLDSVITAVGMAEDIRVMIAAVVISVGVMLVFANPISNFVERNPTLKMLALSFLILISVMLIAEGVGSHLEKGHLYFAMAFALVVELLNLKVRRRHK